MRNIESIELKSINEHFLEDDKRALLKLNNLYHHTFKPNVIIIHIKMKGELRISQLTKSKGNGNECNGCVFKRTLWSGNDQKYHCAPFSCEYDMNDAVGYYRVIRSYNYDSSLYKSRLVINNISRVLSDFIEKSDKILFINIKR